MTDLAQAEYEALRATIRERGTLRIWAILVGVVGWAGLAMTLLLTNLQGANILIPFIVLAATFEVSFFIHTGVERIGRYIQVFFEEASGSTGPSTSSGRAGDDEPRWETTAMNYGRSFPGGLDPLFIAVFAVIGFVNLLSSVAVTRRPGWVLLCLFAHLIFGWRLLTARRLAASQRATDLERFRALKDLPLSN